ncbi:MAG: prolipoprotein diacylglyceryl transferase family protein [Acidimicrobiales bacterium]
MKPIPVSFHIGPLLVHTYGIGLAITFWFGYRYFEHRLRDNGYEYQWFTGVFLWVVVTAIVGARLVHVLANFSHYSSNPTEILAVWHGGLSSFGGLLGGLPTGLLLARRRYPELSTIRTLDLLAPVLMASWGIGRLLGPQLMVDGGGHRTSQWFGMQYANGLGGYTPKELPVPIFQAIESFVIFGILIVIERRLRKRPLGTVVGSAMALWGLERFVEQHLWLSTGGLGSLLVQIAGLGLFGAGLVTLAALWRRQAHGALDEAASGVEDSSTSAAEVQDSQDAAVMSVAQSPVEPGPAEA